MNAKVNCCLSSGEPIPAVRSSLPPLPFSLPLYTSVSSLRRNASANICRLFPSFLFLSFPFWRRTDSLISCLSASFALLSAVLNNLLLSASYNFPKIFISRLCADSESSSFARRLGGAQPESVFPTLKATPPLDAFGLFRNPTSISSCRISLELFLSWQTLGTICLLAFRGLVLSSADSFSFLSSTFSCGKIFVFVQPIASTFSMRVAILSVLLR